MKKIAVLLLIFSVIFLTACIKKEPEKNTLDKIIDRDYIIVGVKTDSRPFGYKNPKTDEVEGFDVDIAKYIAKELLESERKIKFVSVTPETRIESITSGVVDIVIATLSITPQREYLIDFSKPYFAAGQTALVRKDSDIYTFADLRNKTSIIVIGSNSEKHIREIIPSAKIIGYRNYDDAFNALVNNEGDALITDDGILAGLIVQNKDFRMLKNRISKEFYAIGLKQTEDKKLKNNLDVIITRMHSDGTIKALKEKWQLN